MKEESRNNLPAIIDFVFEESQVRTLFNTETNEGYVCLSDLLKAQGSTTHPSQVLPELEEIFGKGVKIVYPLETPGGVQDTIFISEHAATFIVSRGRTEVSKRLNRWLFTEVLPAIRKTGSYTIKDGPHRKAFDASIAKRHALGIKIARDTLKMSRELGVDLYEAKVRACEEATRISGIDFTHLIPLIPKEEKKTKAAKKEQPIKPGLVAAFFEVLNRYPKRERDEWMELRDGLLFLRLSKAFKAIRSRGHRFIYAELIKVLKEHPAFIKSNVSCRAAFGTTVSTVKAKVWIFDQSILSASSEDRERGRS